MVVPGSGGLWVDRAKIPDLLFDPDIVGAINLYTTCRTLGNPLLLPFGSGGWAEQPARLMDVILCLAEEDRKRGNQRQRNRPDHR